MGEEPPALFGREVGVRSQKDGRPKDFESSNRWSLNHFPAFISFPRRSDPSEVQLASRYTHKYQNRDRKWSRWCLMPPATRGDRKTHRLTAVARQAKKKKLDLHPQNHQPTFRVSGELLSSAPPALVWQVLTDYDGAASIFGNVSESKVLGPLGEHRKGEGEGEGGSDGKEASVAAAAPAAAAPASTASPFLSAPFEPSAIEQHCSWKFLLFGGSFRMLLGVEEGPSSESSSPSSSDTPSDSDASAAGEGRSLVFSLLEPGFVRAFEGMWSVAVVEEEEEEGGGWKSSSGGGGGEVSSSSGGGRGGGGRRRRYRTIVKHSLGVTPAVPPPLPIRPVVRKLFQKQVAGLLDDLERELERRMKFL